MIPAGFYSILALALDAIEAKIDAAEAAATECQAIQELAGFCPLCTAFIDDGNEACPLCPAYASDMNGPCDRAIDARRMGVNSLCGYARPQDSLSVKEVLFIWREALADARHNLEEQVAPF
jgi:hypothetical protein